jgi:hypothetical protein
METEPPPSARDGVLHYRHDSVTGQRIAVLPATCRRGVDSLARVGYRAQHVPSSHGRAAYLRLTCKGCEADRTPEYCWTLATTDPAPARAEFDNTPYLDRPMFYGERPAGWPQGLPFAEIIRRSSDWSRPANASPDSE